jgi:hypothetical protein
MAAMELNAIATSAPEDFSRIPVGILNIIDVPIIKRFKSDPEINAGAAHLLAVDLEGWGYLRDKSRSHPVHLIHQRTDFLLDAGYIQAWLLKNVADGPLAPGSPDTAHNESYTAPRKIGVEFPELGGKAVLLIGEIINRGRPHKAIAYLYTREFKRLK